MLGVKETRFSVQRESCGLNESACKSKQKWNLDKYWSVCKKIRWLKFDYMRNPSTCDSECNKDCKIDEYSDIKNCSCGKCLSRKLILACKNKILNTAKTSLNDKMILMKK